MNGGKRQWILTFHPGLPALVGTFYDSLLTAPWLLGEGRESAISCGFLCAASQGWGGDDSPGQTQDDACIQTRLASFL